ncbi:MAG: bifunctional nuclease family protein [Muribaculaceae bacterium]|nr:bifunctional nuclease family protein [Muribaculaceae bacterium]
MKKRHRLRLIGITYNQIESGVYAVILEEVDGERRLPIVIGYAEAQAIECKLQEVKTPRPLTHDLMKSILDSFSLNLHAIEIYKLPNGVFAADLLIEDSNGNLRRIDSRSSDALALAIRYDAPIFTSSEVLDESGFRPRRTSQTQDKNKENLSMGERMLMFPESDSSGGKAILAGIDNLEEALEHEIDNSEENDSEILAFLSNYTDKEIEHEIAKFAFEEKYEIAARLKSLLKKRNQGE